MNLDRHAEEWGAGGTSSLQWTWRVSGAAVPARLLPLARGVLCEGASLREHTSRRASRAQGSERVPSGQGP